MIDDHDIQLLGDLLKLAVKHGPDRFLRLANLLRNQQVANRLADILGEIGVQAKRQEPGIARKRPTQDDQIKKFLTRVSKEDSTKANILRQIHNTLAKKDILPTVSDIRRFAATEKIRLPKTGSRSRFLLPLLKSLVQKSSDELDRMFLDLQNVEARGGGDLQGWSDVILRQGKELEKKHTP